MPTLAVVGAGAMGGQIAYQAALHGYDVYYLNVMAGPVRTWKFYNAPEHEWLLKQPAV